MWWDIEELRELGVLLIRDESMDGVADLATFSFIRRRKA